MPKPLRSERNAALAYRFAGKRRPLRYVDDLAVRRGRLRVEGREFPASEVLELDVSDDPLPSIRVRTTRGHVTLDAGAHQLHDVRAAVMELEATLREELGGDLEPVERDWTEDALKVVLQEAPQPAVGRSFFGAIAVFAILCAVGVFLETMPGDVAAALVLMAALLAGIGFTAHGAAWTWRRLETELVLSQKELTLQQGDARSRIPIEEIVLVEVLGVCETCIAVTTESGDRHVAPASAHDPEAVQALRDTIWKTVQDYRDFESDLAHREASRRALEAVTSRTNP